MSLGRGRKGSLTGWKLSEVLHGLAHLAHLAVDSICRVGGSFEGALFGRTQNTNQILSRERMNGMEKVGTMLVHRRKTGMNLIN